MQYAIMTLHAGLLTYNTTFRQFINLQLVRNSSSIRMISLCSAVEIILSRSVLNQNLRTILCIALDFWSKAQKAVAKREIFVS